MIADALLNVFQRDPTVKRHLAKTVSWRLLGSLDTVMLGWFITGDVGLGARIGGLELLTKMILYFVHERVWHKVQFGLPSRRIAAERVKKENAANLFQQTGLTGRHQREEKNGNRSFTIWLTGLSGAGKSTIAAELDKALFYAGIRAYVIDGDNTRLGINSDLSFTREDRSENIRRVAEICRLFNDAGTIAIASFISPFEADRVMARSIIGAESFVEVFVDASLDTCKARDKKGLYKLAEQGKLKNFTGVDSPYERPDSPQVHLATDTILPAASASLILEFLKSEGVLVFNTGTDR